MKPRLGADDPYLAAFAEVLSRIQQTLNGSRRDIFPIKMYVAGGAALHLLTGARVSADVDAVFSKRVMFSEDISVSYRDADGRARYLYLDRSYNDTLGLLHEDANDDSKPIDIPGVDKKLIDVRVLSPLDLAVSKLSRFSDQDREDILLLAREGLISAATLRKRAEEALGGYVGDLAPVRNSVDVACNLVNSTALAKRR
jgi:hypothetical protein